MIGGMLASGGIVTTAATLRLYFALKGQDYLPQAVLWTVRESVRRFTLFLYFVC